MKIAPTTDIILPSYYAKDAAFSCISKSNTVGNFTNKQNADLKKFKELVSVRPINYAKLIRLANTMDNELGSITNFKPTKGGLDIRSLTDALETVYKEAMPVMQIVPKKTRNPRKLLVAKTTEELEIEQLNAEAATWWIFRVK